MDTRFKNLNDSRELATTEHECVAGAAMGCSYTLPRIQWSLELGNESGRLLMNRHASVVKVQRTAVNV